MAIIAAAVFGYLLVGFLSASFRAWRIGVHRMLHSGKRDMSCRHWACDFMWQEFLFLIVIAWPIVVPISLLFLWFGLLIQGPHLMSQPPIGEAPGRVVEPKAR